MNAFHPAIVGVALVAACGSGGSGDEGMGGSAGSSMAGSGGAGATGGTVGTGGSGGGGAGGSDGGVGTGGLGGSAGVGGTAGGAGSGGSSGVSGASGMDASAGGGGTAGGAGSGGSSGLGGASGMGAGAGAGGLSGAAGSGGSSGLGGASGMDAGGGGLAGAGGSAGTSGAGGAAGSSGAGAAGTGGSAGSSGAAGNAGSDGGPPCMQSLSGDVDTDLDIPAGCLVDVTGTVRLRSGATLTIGAGAILAFGSGSELRVGTDGCGIGNCSGRIIAAGTSAAPIQLTSAAFTPAAGDWAGIELGQFSMAGTLFDNVVFEHAGSDGTAALQLGDTADGATFPPIGAVTLRNSTFRDNSDRGVCATATGTTNPRASFAELSNNTFVRNGADSMYLHSHLVHLIGPGNTFDAPVRFQFTLALSGLATWRALDTHYVAAGNLVLNNGSLVLVIESGAEVRLPSPSAVDVVAGSLRATNVLFRSASAAPLAGDWQGIRFRSSAGTSLLDGCTISHAGRNAGLLGEQAVRFDTSSVALVTDIVGTTFSNNGGDRNIQAQGVCTKFTTTASPPNTFDITPACE